MQVATNTTPLEYGLPSAFMEMATKPLLERERRISLVRERPCQSGGGTNTEYHLPFIVHPTLRSLRCASEQRISSSETPTLGIPIKHSSRNESANSLKVTARRKSLNPDQTPLAQYTVHNVNTKRAGKRTESGLGMGVGCARLIRYRCCAPAVCGRQRSGRKKKPVSAGARLALFLSSSSSNDQTLYPRILSTTFRKESDQYNTTVTGSVPHLLLFCLSQKTATKKIENHKKIPDTYLSTPPNPKKNRPTTKFPIPAATNFSPLARKKRSTLYRSLVLCLPSPFSAHGILARLRCTTSAFEHFGRSPRQLSIPAFEQHPAAATEGTRRPRSHRTNKIGANRIAGALN